MGWHVAFAFESRAKIFREHAALFALSGVFGLDFDISGLGDLDDRGYAELPPTRWPVKATRQGGRFFGDGVFFHPDGRARMISVRFREPAALAGLRFPFRLNTGRIRDQWHTMTRTALSPRLSAHRAEPFLDIHPGAAAALGLQLADLVRLKSPQGAAIPRAWITRDVLPGEVLAPMHWTAQTVPSARIETQVAPVTDPVSGQPESKASVVAIERPAIVHQHRRADAGLGPCAGQRPGRIPSSFRLLRSDAAQLLGWEALTIIKG